MNKQHNGPSPEQRRTHDEQVKGMQFVNFLQLRILSFINTPAWIFAGDGHYLIYD